MKNLISALGAAALLCGCSVMHFQNGEVVPEGRTIEQWHHNVAYSLLEISKPLDMKELCGNKPWSMVTTKETFLTGLAGGVDEAVTAPLTAGVGVNVWDPQMVEYTCGK